MIIPKTDKPYFLVCSQDVLYHKAEELHLNVFRYESDSDLQDLVRSANDLKMPVVILECDPKKEKGSHTVWEETVFFFYNTFKTAAPDGTEIRSAEKTAEYLEDLIKELEEFMMDNGIIPSTNYTDRCGNCHGYLEPDMKYCPYCGTKRGEGKYEPFLDRICCLYGPPLKTKVDCKGCGKKWKVVSSGLSELKFCPECGSAEITKNEKRDWSIP